MKRRVLTVCACLLVAAASVFGTLAYLTDKATVTNTFTVGKNGISLDEAKVGADGKKLTGESAARVAANSYKLLPGGVYDKDPTVTVDADSEPSYIRMKVTVNDMTALKAAFPVADYPSYYKGELFLLEKLVDYDKVSSPWRSTSYAPASSGNAGTYEFRYKETVSTADAAAKELEPLFTTVTIPGTVDNDHLDYLAGIEITVTAEAIQAYGFADANAAWAAFDAQTAA